MYDPSGRKLALMNGQTLHYYAFVPLPGGLTAKYVSSGVGSYMHPDWLGSSRMESQPYPAAPYIETAYAPFGEGLRCCGHVKRVCLLSGRAAFPVV
ncbi:MAG TPA: hypothetical protein VKG84_13620 [Candidatus Acidoferrales bacterium]|nr:hypothetical protein [Candidatus Acidoferrales bacterium]